MPVCRYCKNHYPEYEIIEHEMNCEPNPKGEDHASEKERLVRGNFAELFKNNPLPDNEILHNLGLFISRQTMSRILFMQELYQKIINIHGVVMEFGVRWGQNLALFETFRGMYEPFNHSRKIIGFDTFEGFPSVHNKDGNADVIALGKLATTKKYTNYLEQVLDYHEQESPISHIKKYEIVKGNLVKTLPIYLDEHPETIIAFAYLDVDLYEPTKKCLELIKDYVVKGSVIGFDELNYPDFPGETSAFKEVMGLDNYTLYRSVHSSASSYIVIGQ